jgi:hypothetical protein
MGLFCTFRVSGRPQPIGDVSRETFLRKKDSRPRRPARDVSRETIFSGAARLESGRDVSRETFLRKSPEFLLARH